MVNTFKFVGVSMTRGIFFKGGRFTFAMGAPKDSNYRGAVYVCKVINYIFIIFNSNVNFLELLSWKSCPTPSSGRGTTWREFWKRIGGL